MKIQCDVCEKAQATVICCADEAALCTKCDIEVHAANKLASKHQRLLLQCLSNKLPPCDICQDKAAFIFCVEDRALFCKDCDESIHSASSLAANHQRFLATGIRVALSSSCNKDAVKSQLEPQPPQQNSQQVALKTPPHHLSGITSPSWPVDDLLEFPDYESNNKKELLELGELEWLGDIDLFGEQTAAEVPELSVSQSSNANIHRPSNANIYKPSNTTIYKPSNTNIYRPSNTNIYKPTKSNMPYKKPRIEIPDEDEFFTVPDLG